MHLDNSLLARAETWVAEIAAHIAKGCSIITTIIGFFRSLIVGVYSGISHVLCLAMGKSEVLWRSIRATIAYFKGIFLRTSSRAWHIALRGFHVTLERTINYLQHLLGTSNSRPILPTLSLMSLISSSDHSC